MQQNVCVIKDKRTFGKNISQKIIVYLDSLYHPLDSIGYLVSPSVIKLRPFPFAPQIEVAYLRTHLYELWFPYLPFYRFSPDRQAFVIKGERLRPQVTAVTQFASILNDLYTNNYGISVSPHKLPMNIYFCKCTNPPEEEQAILERENFAEKVLTRFFKVSDSTAEKFDEMMYILDGYLEKFHTLHIPILYYSLAGVAGDYDLLTALISAVAGSPEALGLELLANKGDIIEATKRLHERQSALTHAFGPSSKTGNKDEIIRGLQEENNKIKRLLQQVVMKVKGQQQPQ
jgi:hypothetical protein